MLLGTGTCTVERVAAASGRGPAHDPPPSRARRRDVFRRSWKRCGGSSPSVTSSDRRRSLAEVSSLLGFSAPSAFSRWYRQQFGASPSQDKDRVPVRDGRGRRRCRRNMIRQVGGWCRCSRPVVAGGTCALTHWQLTRSATMSNPTTRIRTQPARAPRWRRRSWPPARLGGDECRRARPAQRLVLRSLEHPVVSIDTTMRLDGKTQDTGTRVNWDRTFGDAGSNTQFQRRRDVALAERHKVRAPGSTPDQPGRDSRDPGCAGAGRRTRVCDLGQPLHGSTTP